jgi:ketosteroid isomerase-like protein
VVKTVALPVAAAGSGAVGWNHASVRNDDLGFPERTRVSPQHPGSLSARKLFDDTFANFESCKVDILELDATVNGDMGIVCTVQSTDIVLKSGATKHVMVRQTDSFERRENGWELIHQHASVPAGGEWDGKLTTA